jgi:Reverse transcriptase (RNA-dependent DNA polymerase)
LLLQLQAIGFGTSALNFFHSYLSDRFHRVIANRSTTEWKEIGKGVPQGSGISPITFNIYVKDLPMAADLRIFQYADDITESVSAKTIEEVEARLTKGFKNTKTHCENLDLLINNTKIQLILFKQPTKKITKDYSLTLENVKISAEKTVKLLGFMLDQHLTFSAHIDSAVMKARNSLGILRKAASNMPKELRKMSYLGITRSHLEYCSSVYMGAAETHMKKLDKVQRIAARIICKTNKDAHAATLLDSLK